MAPNHRCRPWGADVLGRVYQCVRLRQSVAQSSVKLGLAFELKPGGVAVLQGEDLRVGFERVRLDSRCPRGAQCIIEGAARVRIWASKASSRRTEYDLETRPPPAAEARHGDYRIRVVNPYPQVDRSTRSSDYVVTLVVTRMQVSAQELTPIRPLGSLMRLTVLDNSRFCHQLLKEAINAQAGKHI